MVSKIRIIAHLKKLGVNRERKVFIKLFLKWLNYKKLTFIVIIQEIQMSL